MTTLLPGRSRDSVVKGLAMLGSRLRHDRKVKCVDAGPGSSVRSGRLLPNDGAHGRRGDDLRRWYVDDATADIGRLSPFPAAAPPLTFSVGRCREFLQRRPSRIRLATTRRSPPGSSPSGFTAWSPALIDPKRSKIADARTAAQGRPGDIGMGLVLTAQGKTLALPRRSSMPRERVLGWRRVPRGGVIRAIAPRGR